MQGFGLNIRLAEYKARYFSHWRVATAQTRLCIYAQSRLSHRFSHTQSLEEEEASHQKLDRLPFWILHHGHLTDILRICDE